MTTPVVSPVSDRSSALGRPLQAYPLSATQKYNPLISALIYWALAQELMDTIERAVNPLIFERTLEAYNAGQPVHFGPIQVSRDGLVCRRQSYAWVEVEAVAVADGRITISRKNGGFFSGARVDAAKAKAPNLASRSLAYKRIMAMAVVQRQQKCRAPRGKSTLD
jgi:hypothetical protein